MHNNLKTEKPNLILKIKTKQTKKNNTHRIICKERVQTTGEKHMCFQVSERMSGKLTASNITVKKEKKKKSKQSSGSDYSILTKNK